MAGRWVTVQEAAAALDIHPRTVRKWIQRGRLTGRRTPEGWLVELPEGAAPDEPPDLPPGTELVEAPGDPPPATVPALMLGQSVDLGPLAQLVRDLAEDNRILALEAVEWRLRAEAAEKALQHTREVIAVPGPSQRPWWAFWRKR